jgi:hypothetical protein
MAFVEFHLVELGFHNYLLFLLVLVDLHFLKNIYCVFLLLC